MVETVIAAVPAVIVLIVRLLVFVLTAFVAVSSKLPIVAVPRIRPLPLSMSLTTTAPLVPVMILSVPAPVLNGVAVLPIVVPDVLSETVLPDAKYVPFAASVIIPFVPAVKVTAPPVFEVMLAPSVIEPVILPPVRVTFPSAIMPVLVVLMAPPLEIDIVLPDEVAPMALRVIRAVCVSAMNTEPLVLFAVIAKVPILFSVISPLAVRFRLPAETVDPASLVRLPALTFNCRRPPTAVVLPMIVAPLALIYAAPVLPVKRVRVGADTEMAPLPTAPIAPLLCKSKDDAPVSRPVKVPTDIAPRVFLIVKLLALRLSLPSLMPFVLISAPPSLKAVELPLANVRLLIPAGSIFETLESSRLPFVATMLTLAPFPAA